MDKFLHGEQSKFLLLRCVCYYGDVVHFAELVDSRGFFNVCVSDRRFEFRGRLRGQTVPAVTDYLQRPSVHLVRAPRRQQQCLERASGSQRFHDRFNGERTPQTDPSVTYLLTQRSQRFNELVSMKRRADCGGKLTWER